MRSAVPRPAARRCRSGPLTPLVPLATPLRSVIDFTNYVNSLPEGSAERELWASFAGAGVLDYSALDVGASWLEALKEERGLLRAVERYSYASTSRVNQNARLGDGIILDQFADQIDLNRDPDILRALAEDVAVMTLANGVARNRGGGTLVCGSRNEVAPDPFLDDYFDVIHRDLACIGCHDSYGDYAKQKVSVWVMNVLEGEDQVGSAEGRAPVSRFPGSHLLSRPLGSSASAWPGVSTSSSTSGPPRTRTTPNPTCTPMTYSLNTASAPTSTS